MGLPYSKTPPISLEVPQAFLNARRHHRKRYGRPAPITKPDKGKSIACPICGSYQGRVIDSRYQKTSNSCRRRRQCAECQYRFTTFELIAPEDILDYQI